MLPIVSKDVVDPFDPFGWARATAGRTFAQAKLCIALTMSILAKRGAVATTKQLSAENQSAVFPCFD